MTDTPPISRETALLAEAFGRALAGLATELKVSGKMPAPEVSALFNKGVGRARTSSGNAEEQPAYDAIVGAMLRAAAI